jgi:hypothetical protein
LPVAVQPKTRQIGSEKGDRIPGKGREKVLDKRGQAEQGVKKPGRKIFHCLKKKFFYDSLTLSSEFMLSDLNNCR